MKCTVYGEDVVCPECGDFLSLNRDVGDGYLYDLCGGLSGCGFKRKKTMDGQEVQRREDA